MSVAVLEQLAREGYFDRAAAGDHRACGLFVRLAAYRLNQSGDPHGWGALRKGGGANVDGYSEDAIVLGSDPANLRNVVDLIGGAGAPGARLATSLDGFVARRPSDTWEAPAPLTAEQMAYLGGTDEGGGTGTPPVVVPPPPVCACDPALVPAVDAVSDQCDWLVLETAKLREDVGLLRAEIADLTARLQQGLIVDANARYLGAIKGTVRLP